MKFNLARMIKLMKRDFIIYRKPILLGYGALLILLIGLIALNVFRDDHGRLSNGDWFGWFGFFLIAGGLTLTSVVFWEFKTASQRMHFLSIPASHFEKVISRWIYTLIIYPTILTLTFFIFYKITDSLTGGTSGSTPFSDFFSEISKFYLIMHAIVFMFSIWLNKYVAPKTVLICIVVSLCLALISAILFRLCFAEFFQGATIKKDFIVLPKPEFQTYVEDNIFPIMEYLVVILPVVFFGLVSYFKMTEKEV